MLPHIKQYTKSLRPVAENRKALAPVKGVAVGFEIQDIRIIGDTAHYGENQLVIAFAECDPSDKFDIYRGLFLATSRAFHKCEVKPWKRVELPLTGGRSSREVFEAYTDRVCLEHVPECCKQTTKIVIEADVDIKLGNPRLETEK